MSTVYGIARDLIERLENESQECDGCDRGSDMCEVTDTMRALLKEHDNMRKDLKAMRNGSIASAREPTLVVTVNVTAPLCDPEQLSQTIKQALDPELRRLTAHKQAIPTVYPVQ